jgi:hypothetical protein
MWKQAFSFPFQDPDWFKKVFLSGLFLLIPLLGAVSMIGWGLEICRAAIRNKGGALPFPRPGPNLRGGMQILAIVLLYLVPLLLAVVCFEAGIHLPPVSGLKAQTAREVADILGWIFGVLCVFFGLSLPLLACAAIGRFAETNRLKDAFHLRNVVRLILKSPKAYLLLLPGLAFQALTGWIGIMVCCIGLTVSLPYSVAVQAHWLGQIHTDASAGRIPPSADV